jgi:hypothetical protein
VCQIDVWVNHILLVSEEEKGGSAYVSEVYTTPHVAFRDGTRLSLAHCTYLMQMILLWKAKYLYKKEPTEKEGRERAHQHS